MKNATHHVDKEPIKRKVVMRVDIIYTLLMSIISV